MNEPYPDATMTAGEQQVVVPSSCRHFEAGRGGKQLQQEYCHHHVGAARGLTHDGHDSDANNDHERPDDQRRLSWDNAEES